MRKVTWIERSEIYLKGHRCYGIANHDDWAIEIDPAFHRSPRQLLETEVHELWHLICPDATERQVRKWAKTMRDELWRLGYRRTR
jgi:hypothetical protein